ncbi:MAG: hypothetical protein WDN06_03250 [Asticcacaulis sp.]
MPSLRRFIARARDDSRHVAYDLLPVLGAGGTRSRLGNLRGVFAQDGAFQAFRQGHAAFMTPSSTRA